MKFNEKVQAFRKKRGLSQEALAEKLDVTRQSIAKWEGGKSYPEIDKLILLSSIFGISIDKLVKDIEDECASSRDGSNNIEVDDDIIEFLIRAKKETYAGCGAEVQSSRPQSHDLHYTEADLKYIDSYLGTGNFVGEEAVWIKDEPYWAMNYSGRVISEGFSGSFLKEALLRVPKENPYRGPMIYESGDYKYHCMINGDFKWFYGSEEIYFNDKKVYECIFHGGIIK